MRHRDRETVVDALEDWRALRNKIATEGGEHYDKPVLVKFLDTGTFEVMDRDIVEDTFYVLREHKILRELAADGRDLDGAIREAGRDSRQKSQRPSQSRQGQRQGGQRQGGQRQEGKRPEGKRQEGQRQDEQRSDGQRQDGQPSQRSEKRGPRRGRRRGRRSGKRPPNRDRGAPPPAA